jgi:hypothetical protein
MQGRALAQCPAQQPPGIAARAMQMTREQSRLALLRERRQAQQVAPFVALEESRAHIGA